MDTEMKTESRTIKMRGLKVFNRGSHMSEMYSNPPNIVGTTFQDPLQRGENPQSRNHIFVLLFLCTLSQKNFPHNLLNLFCSLKDTFEKHLYVLSENLDRSCREFLI